MLIPVAILIGPLGTLLMVVGMRGRKTDDHPHCKRCGFDVFGVYPDSPHCPECGAWLDGAIHDGGRERRRGFVVAGVLMMVLGGLFTALQASSLGYRVLPDAVLAWTLSDDLAREEVKSRLAAGEFNHTPARWVIHKALDVQRDRAVVWHPSWGELIETAWVGGYTSPADLERYAEQAVGFELKARPVVKRGISPEVYPGLNGEARLGWNTAMTIEFTQMDFLIDGQAVKLHPATNSRIQVGRSAGMSVHHLPTESLASELGRINLSLSFSPRYSLNLHLKPGVSSIAPFTVAQQMLSAEIEVVENFTGTYAAGGKSVSEREEGVGLWYAQSNSSSHKPDLFFGLHQAEPIGPVKAWAESEGVYHPLQVMRSRWGNDQVTGSHFCDFRLKLQDLSPDVLRQDAVNLVIRTDVASLEAKAQVEPVWVGQWRFERVPLRGGTSGRWSAHGIVPPHKLVPVTVTALTPEEAMQEPETALD